MKDIAKKMNDEIVYEVILRFDGDKPDVCIFYDDDEQNVLREIQTYVEYNGFTYCENGNLFSIKSIIVRERGANGKILREKERKCKGV